MNATFHAAAAEQLTTVDILLWVALPYAAIAIFLVGHYWRYRYDKFGWTTRSSQLYENRLLRLGSPLFHFGILLVIVGHIVGLLIPEGWTEAVGISEPVYHAFSVGIGVLTGAATLVGAAILIYRRRTTGPVFSATTRNDKVMYVLLIGTLLLGFGTTVISNAVGHPHDYRQTVSPWFRSVLSFRPDTDLILAAPLGFQLHVIAAWVLFAFWPFTRLVHVFSMPVGYLTRPYIVYRSRDVELGSRRERRGWERIR
ncbi:respiratory nitrate reductase subunit gamma [Nocardia flavorosea]|uniref:respiratory nitrate reductase subunit gamma n=1 Tax=Nocardia flavorosea TaxID=53429 RepID=UPI00189520A8|nr:respiratory nitrate reductase subunit gamma [Nocardia flavorosea]MBF6349529.1 respiratory nitrate reductase subunit gamma [Nocardia flavorosea]